MKVNIEGLKRRTINMTRIDKTYIETAFNMGDMNKTGANDMTSLNGDTLTENKAIRVGFKRLTDEATMPTKAHVTDSGFDLYAAEDAYIEPGETKVIPTNIAILLPTGYEAQVRPRSGITAKTRLRVQLGTIDNDYTGDIGIIADYLHASDFDRGTDDVYYINEGDRIAQLVVQELPQAVQFEVTGDIEETQRGSGGYGSTGVREDD